MRWLPRGGQKLLGMFGQHPGRLFLVLVVGGILVYYSLLPSAPPPATRPAKAESTIPGQGIDQTMRRKHVLDVDQQNKELQVRLEDMERAQRERDRKDAQAEQQRKIEAEALAQRIQAMGQTQTQQIQAMVEKLLSTKGKTGEPKPAAKSPAPSTSVTLASNRPASQSPSVRPSAAKIEILRNSTVGTGEDVTPATAFDPQTPYLPTGSLAPARIITGVMALARAGGKLPVLVALTQPFSGPWQLRGPGRTPRETEIPLQGCFLFGTAQGDLGTQRVHVELETLTCIWPDKSAFERPIKGYITGLDKTLGVVGKLERHDSEYIVKSFLSSLMAGAAESFKLAKQTQIVTPFGGTVTSQQGHYGETAGFAALATASAQLSQFYLQQAAQLLPTLWVEANTPIVVVIREGVSLEGFPAVALVER